MKKILLAAAFSLICAPALLADPEITFDSTAHDFGTIKEKNGKVECTFSYTNTGNEPLVLTTVSAPCGCTKPDYSHKPLAPGKSSQIKIHFNPAGISGEFMRTITVRTNIKAGNAKKKVTLKINGVVIPEK